MMVNVRIALRGAALASVAAVTLAACGGGSSGGRSASPAGSSSGTAPSAGSSAPSASWSGGGAGTKDGGSIYEGPHDTSAPNKDGQAAYDQAVVCSADNKTITFHLNQPIGDSNYAVTLGMSAVPKAKDTKVKYTDAPWSDGPSQIQS